MPDPFENKDKIQHQVTDTDLNWSSPHHTIGKGPTQAAAGKHRHTYDEIDEPPVIPGVPPPPDLTPFVRKDGDEMTGNLVMKDGSAVNLNGPGSINKAINWLTGSSPRWALFAESGTSQSHLDIGRYDNSGAWLGTIARFDRITGAAIFYGAVSVTPTLSSGWSGNVYLSVRAGWVIVNFINVKKSTAPATGDVLFTVAPPYKSLAALGEIWISAGCGTVSTGGGAKSFLCSMNPTTGQMMLRGNAMPLVNEGIYGSLTYPYEN